MLMMVRPYGRTTAVLFVVTRSLKGEPCGSRLMRTLTSDGHLSAMRKLRGLSCE